MINILKDYLYLRLLVKAVFMLTVTANGDKKYGMAFERPNMVDGWQ